MTSSPCSPRRCYRSAEKRSSAGLIRSLPLVRESLAPLLERAVAEGRLRPEVKIGEAARWLQGVCAFSLLHGAADNEALRWSICIFALPSALASG